jgi:hypothetical protein
MKKQILLLLLFSLSYVCVAQDIIVRTTNDTIHAKILSVDSTNIQYQTRADGITTKQTISRKYVSDFFVNAESPEYAENAIADTASKKKNSSFRIGFAAGIARHGGANVSYDDLQMNKVADELKTGFGFDAEFQYFFNANYGIALNVNYARFSGSARIVSFPDIGTVSVYK